MPKHILEQSDSIHDTNTRAYQNVCETNAGCSFSCIRNKYTPMQNSNWICGAHDDIGEANTHNAHIDRMEINEIVCSHAFMWGIHLCERHANTHTPGHLMYTGARSADVGSCHMWSERRFRKYTACAVASSLTVNECKQMKMKENKWTRSDGTRTLSHMCSLSLSTQHGQSRSKRVRLSQETWTTRF